MTSPIPVFDADSHLAEVPDLWTSRLPTSKWGDEVPHVVFDERLKRDRWVIAGRMLTSVANWAVAGWNGQRAATFSSRRSSSAAFSFSSASPRRPMGRHGPCRASCSTRA